MSLRETDLYPPIKAYLESMGYAVKGEVGAVDVMAVRGGDPPVLVELKLRFSLALVQQGIDRQGLSDAVYLAVARPKGGLTKGNLRLCRRLGLGLIEVRPGDGHVTVLCDPVPYRPRKAVKRVGRLLREFARLEGDPNAGGGTRRGLVTAYRQDALRCAAYLRDAGPSRGAEVARATGVAAATRLMADNHYGWFARIARGTYALTAAGGEAIGSADR